MEEKTRKKWSLHRRAKQAAKSRKPDISGLSPDKIEELVQELSIHQIELELQNEDLLLTQQEMLKARDRYADLYNSSPAGHFTLNARNNFIVEVNLAACRFLGMPRQSVLKTPFTRYIDPAFEDSLYICCRTAKESRAPQTCEIRMVRPEGDHFWVLLHILYRPGGQLSVVVLDINERKKAQEALNAQKQVLQALFDHIPVLLVMWDPEQRNFTLNRHAEDVLGWTTAEANEGDFMSMVYPDPAYRAAASAYMSALTPGWREWDCTTKYGETVPAEWANVQLADNTMIGIGVDLRERKMYEKQVALEREQLEILVMERTGQLIHQVERLKAAEGNLDLLIDSMPDGILVVEEDGSVLFANATAARLFGYEKEEIIGTRPVVPVPEQMTEVSVSSGDGKLRMLEIHKTHITWRGQECYLAMFRDITERRRSERRVRSLSHRLVEVQEKERREMGHALHDEVGGTITVLKLAVSQARKKLGEQAHALDEIDEISKELAEQIRFISHSLRPSTLDDYGLSEALEWYVERYRERTGINVNLSHDQVDNRFPSQVETAAYRIVQEALTNAAKYSGSESIDVQLTRRQDELVIMIKDGGKGFDPEDIAEGTGITGMQDIAELTGGSLTLDSSPGVGTVVIAKLPLKTVR